MPSFSTRTRATRLLAVAAASTAALAVAAPAATAAPVTGGHLDWSSADVYVSGAARTWLGYVTTLAGGTATPTAPATGPTVNAASPKGETAIATWQYPLTGGTYVPATKTGSVTSAGTVTFASTTYGFTISVANPVVALNGATGTLSASGSGAAGPYTAAAPLFNLDLSQATYAPQPDGSTLISGIVPSLATVGTAFPPNYQVGAGPDRTPNTFGSFALTVAGGYAATSSGKQGVVTVKLTAFPSSTKQGRVTVKLGRRTVASGTIKGRTVTLPRTQQRLPKGTYTLSGPTVPGKSVTFVIA